MRNFRNAMGLFLGIDGGGTSTRCALADERGELARASGSSCKISLVGEEATRSALRSVIQEVCSQAGVEPKQISQSCIGVAGAARTPVVDLTRRILEELVGGGVEVVGDMVIALESAFGSGPGIIVISGTGSICFGRDAHGETARAGGWGPEVSDEGSGTWIGRQAVSHALRAHDSGQHTALLPALMSSWGVASRDELSQKANSSPPPDFSLLAPRVFEAAKSSDHLASAILDQAGAELAELASIVAHRLWPARQNMRMAFAGGVLLNSDHVRSAFFGALKTKLPEVEVLAADIDPAAGAIAIARRSAAAPAVRQAATRPARVV